MIEATPILAMAIPAAGAVAIGLLGRWPNLRETATLVTAALLLLVVLGITGEQLERGGGFGELTSLGELLPGMALEFRVEALGVIYALVASSLWILNSLYSIGYMRSHAEKNQTRFYMCFALAIASVMGIAFASNMFTLFVFYEALTMTTYPLVAHASTPHALRSARTYLGVLVTTSICFLLLGVIWTWHLTGDLDFSSAGVFAGPLAAGQLSLGTLALLYGLYVYGIGKAAVMPAHRWLPAAMVAPTPVSALLHAVAVVKAGVFSVVKVTVYVFGVDTLAKAYDAVAWADFFVYASAFTIVAGSGVALFQDNLKRRLAYSTISQLSYLVLGAALLTEHAITGAGLHLVMHAWGKITLFFCAGAIYVAAHKTEISDMRGLGRKMPLTFGAFLLASLSIIGLPPLGGSWSKWYLVLGSIEAERAWLVWVLVASSLLNIAYLLPVAVNGFWGKPAADDHHDDHHDDHGKPFLARFGLAEAPAFCVVPLCLTAIGSFALFLFPGPILDLAKMIGS